MKFDYFQYYQACFVDPFIAGIFFSVFLLGQVIVFIRWWRRRIMELQGSICNTIFLMMVITVFISLNIGRLLHGGIFLMTEKEIDAERMQGNILEIKELGQFAMPRMKTEYGNGRGVEITIQNIQCTVPAKGTLKVGDYVEVEYLPKSGYILYINEMANKKIAYNNKDNKELLITNTYSSYEIDKLRRNVSCGKMSLKDLMNDYKVECLRKTHEGYYAILMQDDKQNIFVFSDDNFQIKSILTINDFKEKGDFENYVKEGLAMSEVLKYDADVVPNPFSSVYMTIHPVREGTFLVRYRRDVEGEVLSEPIVESIEYYSLSESSMETDKYSYVPYILELDRTNK